MFLCVWGTSRHLSVGTYALVSLMVYSTISQQEAIYLDSLVSSPNPINMTDNNGSLIAELDPIVDLMEFRIKVATSLCFWCGIIQVKILPH